MRKAGDKSGADRIGNLREYDWYGAGSQGGTGCGKNHVWIARHQFRCIGPHPAGISATPTVINFEVAAFDPSVLQQTKPKSCNSGLPFRIGFRGPGDQYAEPPHVIWLLRACGERPCGGGPSNYFDEIASSHCLPRGQDYAE
jgi:hypothetical protein